MSSEFGDRAAAAPGRRYEWGESLGRRPLATRAVLLRRDNGDIELVTGIRLERNKGISADEVSAVVRCARALAATPHRCLAPMRDAVVDDGDVLLLGGFVDGESLESVAGRTSSASGRLPLEVSLRVVADVLEGLEALHSLRDADGRGAGYFHSEVTPSNVIVGIDGSARLIHACRVPGVCLMVPGAPRYLAPELLLREAAIDYRADIYSAGVLLWEAIAGAPLFPEDKTTAIIRRILMGALPAPPVPTSAPWATALGPLTTRALCIDPSLRFDTARAMREQLEVVAAGHIASHDEVARWICNLAAERVAMRRKRLGAPPIELPTFASLAPAATPALPRQEVVHAPSPPLYGFDALQREQAPDVGGAALPLIQQEETKPSEVPSKRRWMWVAAIATFGFVALGAIAFWALGGDSAEVATQAGASTVGNAQDRAAGQTPPGPAVVAAPHQPVGEEDTDIARHSETDGAARPEAAGAADTPSEGSDGRSEPRTAQEPAAQGKPAQGSGADVSPKAPAPTAKQRKARGSPVPYDPLGI